MKRAKIAVLVIFLLLFVQINFIHTQPTQEEKRQAVQEFIEKHPELVSKFFDLLVVMETVKTNYVDEKNREEILNLAIKGMANGLDPYGYVFIDKEAQDFLQSMKEMTRVGVGMSISKLGQDIYVMSVVKGSPAGDAGIEPGDLIVKVNDKSLFGLNSDQVANLIKNGAENTEVILETKSRRYQKPQILTVTRKIITYPSVESRQLDNQTGYIKILSFESETPQRFLKELESLKGNRGLIIDLRGNPGGLLNSVSKILGYFVGPWKTIIVEKGRTTQTEIKTLAFKKNYPQNVVVLINNFSASASEIMAGNMKYYKIATLIGVRTFGKALVQDSFDVDMSKHDKDKTQLLVKLTIRRYLLPNRQDISSSGVEPDIEIEQGENFREYDYTTANDIQFQKAIEFLKDKH